MRICGGIIHNGARYEFISLSGDMKFVYRNLLTHMKKWKVRFGHIDVDGKWKYSVYVGDNDIIIHRWPECIRKVELSSVYGSVEHG